MNKVDVLIIGGGPAGLMAANVFEKEHINYALLEKNDQLAKKLLLTGGKRCNMTNNLSISQFIESLNMKHRRFLYPALMSFNSKDILAFFEQKGLRFLLEQSFKYFPETGKSISVLEALTKDIDPKHILLQENVKHVSYVENVWHVQTSHQVFTSNYLIIATGSKAYPSTGSSGDGFLFAEKLGIQLTPLYPAETHVYIDLMKTKYADLQGLSIQNGVLTVNNSRKTYHGGLLFTHFGLSGPSILHASEDIAKRMLLEDVYVSFSISEKEEDEVIGLFHQAIEQNLLLTQFLDQVLMKRLVKKIMEWLSFDNKKLHEFSKKDRALLLETILHFRLKIDRVESLEKAFVNAGGIDVSELDPKSMRVKKYESLYCVGEVTDLQGPIGGFNMTIAFSTAHLAAQHIVNQLKFRTKT